MSKTYLGIGRDHSGSMHSITRPAMRDFNETVASVASSSAATNQETIASVILFGVSGGPRFETVLTPIQNIPVLTSYDSHGNTPLLDATGDLINHFEQIAKVDPTAAFVIMMITDGEEYGSHRWRPNTLLDKIRQLQATDRWTFVFRVPKGYARKLTSQFGIPAGNILEWDQSERGVVEATAQTKSAFTDYFQARSLGATSTNKFYTNLKDVDVKTIQASLVDISAHVRLMLTSAKEVIKPFCEAQTGKPFVKGAAFYQLTKTEPEVQDYKKVVIRHKVTGAVYGGPAARDLLGLPQHGMSFVKPGDHGDYDIYIQSTSINRVLPPGTQLLYWPDHETTPVHIPTAPVAKAVPTPTPVKKTPAPKKAAPAPVASKPAVQPRITQATWNATLTNTNGHSTEFVDGYKQGFLAGKVKAVNIAEMGVKKGVVNDFNKGYLVGYKDGRGKKKKLYK